MDTATVLAETASVTAPDLTEEPTTTAPEPIAEPTSTVPQVGNYTITPGKAGKLRLRGPDGKLIAEAFDTDADARWYANRLTRLAGLWAAQAAGGKAVYMPKVPGNVGQYTIAPHPKGWQVQAPDLTVVGPVWTDKRNGKVDAFRWAERCVRQAG